MSSPDSLSPLRQRLAAIFVAEMNLLESFVATLEEERDALKDRDAEPLYLLAERKTAAARQLQQFATSRAMLLAQAGFKHDRAGIEGLLAGEYAEVWQRYLDLARQAREQNEANGRHITQRMGFNHQALAILMANSDQPATYGPDGTSRPRPGSRHLGSV